MSKIPTNRTILRRYVDDQVLEIAEEIGKRMKTRDRDDRASGIAVFGFDLTLYSRILLFLSLYETRGRDEKLSDEHRATMLSWLNNGLATLRTEQRQRLNELISA